MAAIFVHYKHKHYMDIQVKIINAFSIGNAGGNPAGVILNADALSATDKQQLATRLGFPETAFVSASQSAAVKLDFFTPRKQIPHCGHATIAVFSYLRQQGLLTDTISSNETIDGKRAIFFEANNAFMEQRAPSYHQPETDFLRILDSLQLSESDLIPGLRPTIVNTGNSFLIVPVQNEATLSQVKPDLALIQAISEQYNLIGYYLYSQPSDQNLDATTRMFAPFYGIDEEAATGMAAGPLACFLWATGLEKKALLRIQQGKFMHLPSESLLEARLDIQDNTITGLLVGGGAYVSGEQMIHL